MKEKICETINVSIDTYIEQQRWDMRLSMDVKCSMGDKEESFTRQTDLDLTKATDPKSLAAYLDNELNSLWGGVAGKLKHITHGEISLAERKARCVFGKQDTERNVLEGPAACSRHSTW